MSTRGLVVRQDSLTEIEAALTRLQAAPSTRGSLLVSWL